MDLSQQHQQHQSPNQQAPQACISCRKQKRKCDKQIPACSLCIRIGRSCDYSVQDQAAIPSSDDFVALQQKVAALEGLLSRDTRGSSLDFGPGRGNGTNASSYWENASPASLLSPSPLPAGPSWPVSSSFPSLFFLDSEAFEYDRFQIPIPHVRVPPGVLSALGSSIELRAMVEEYFATVHTYFPIISKIRLYQHLANPMHEPVADIAVLFMAMKLVSSEVPEAMPPQTQLYQDVKSFINYVESQNGYSTQLVQALLMMALYELGHGIYPASYMSIGHLARIGHAMGLHDRGAPQMIPRCNTWTEQEERRRVWWGVIILDRFVQIGHRRKPFATSDPSLDTHLPTDDSHWDRGQMLVAAPLALSASKTIKCAPFARTCQASHLLGKILRHINDKNLPLDYRFDEALQLNRTMRALSGLLPHEAAEDEPTQGPTLCSSMAVCYSALLVLYDQYSCTERIVDGAPETQLIMQKEAIDGLLEISALVVALARRVRSFIEDAGLSKLSPLIVDSLYQAAANYAWYLRESSSAESAERLSELKEVLLILDRRWKVAGEYIKIIEATEFNLASASR